MKAIALYMPVVHQGYLAFIKRHLPADILLITACTMKQVNETMADQLGRDLRAIDTEIVQRVLQTTYSSKVDVLYDINYLSRYKTIVMPDEDVSHAIHAKIGSAIEVIFDKPFLRHDWGSTNAAKEVIPDTVISTSELDRTFMDIAEAEAQKSSDFWRQVGAVVPLEDGKFLIAFNHHLPTPMEPYTNGDIRLIMRQGEKPEICGAIHAERSIFTQALKFGIPLEGKNIYTTTYPCLQCAQMIGEIGFKKLFFREGYSNQNAAEVLKAAGVEVIRVQ